MPVTEYPVRRRLSTTNPDRAHQWLRDCYSAHEVHLPGSPEAFRLDHTFIDCGGFSASRIDYTWSMRAITAPTDHVSVVELIHGHYRIGYHRDVTVRGGGIVLYPSGVPLASDWDRVVAHVIRLPAGSIAAHLGCEPRDLCFDSLQPVSAAHARHWSSLVRHVTRAQLPSGIIASSGLVRDATTRLLVATLLETFSINCPQRVESLWGAPAVVRRAVRFIEDNARRPISRDDIARSARVSVSWLHEAFRRQLGMPPMAYLRRVRMAGAHQDLKVGHPGRDTVAGIAARWGFAPGKFATAYKCRYRCPPSITLRS